MAKDDTVGARLERLREAAGLSRRGLAVKAGLNETAVRDIEGGRSRNPTYNTLSALAAVLGCSISDLVGQAEGLPRFVPVQGAVDRHAWREEGASADTAVREIPIAPDPRFPDAESFAFELRDDSLAPDATKGSYLVCVPLEATGRAAQEGDLLVVRETMNGLYRHVVVRAGKGGRLPAPGGPASRKADRREIAGIVSMRVLHYPI